MLFLRRRRHDSRYAHRFRGGTAQPQNDTGRTGPVWPFEQGSKRGYAFLPLYKKAPQAALKDHELYQLLALVDALRDGSARERELAKRELSSRLKN